MTELAVAVAETSYDVPVLGCSMPDTVRRASAIDVQAYIMKPIDGEALMASLGRLSLAADARILIVDDEPDAVRLLEALVTGGLSQYRVLRAFGGEEALQIMQAEMPDLVLMDLVMPGIGADGLLRRVAESPQLRRIPVVIVTGQDAHPTDAIIGTEITLTSSRPVAALQGISRLKALLDVVTPDYLPDQAVRSRPGVQSLGDLAR